MLGEVSQVAKRRPAFAAKVREIMALRYGLHDGQLRLLKDVGESFGMSKQGIPIVEHIAPEYLRQPRWSRPLRLYAKPRKVK